MANLVKIKEESNGCSALLITNREYNLISSLKSSSSFEVLASSDMYFPFMDEQAEIITFIK
jgi:hypothetical protein